MSTVFVEVSNALAGTHGSASLPAQNALGSGSPLRYQPCATRSGRDAESGMQRSSIRRPDRRIAWSPFSAREWLATMTGAESRRKLRGRALCELARTKTWSPIVAHDCTRLHAVRIAYTFAKSADFYWTSLASVFRLSTGNAPFACVMHLRQRP